MRWNVFQIISQKIGVKLSFVVITAMTVLLAIEGAGNYLFTANRLKEDLNIETELLLTRLRPAITNAFWEYNFDQINILFDSEMRAKNIEAIALLSLDESHVFVSLVKDANNQIVSIAHTPKDPNLLEKSVIIEKGGVALGKIKIFFTLKYFNLTLDTLVLRSIIATLLLDLVVLVILGFLIKKYLTQPLNTLEKSISQVSSGNLIRQVKIDGNDEFNHIAHSFNHMTKSLIESELNYRVLVENATEPIFSLNQKGEFVSVNSPFLRFFGLRNEDIIYHNFKELFNDDNHSSSLAYAINEVLHFKKSRAVVCELRATATPDYKTIFKAIISPVFGVDERLSSLVTTFQDITIFQQVQEEITLAKNAAEASNRAKSQFLANMSHEMRTPMNAVIGMTDLVLLTDLSDTQKTYLSYVKSGAKRLLKLINDILDLAKIEAGKIELSMILFDLHELLKENQITYQTILKDKPIDFELFIEDSVPQEILGDPLRVHQILNNLLGNAVKFTHQGKITLKVEMAVKSLKSVTLKFSVIDTGIGIPAEKIGRLFQYFSQADESLTRKYGGSGLGLAISKALCREMEGDIEVSSKADHGSTFSFTARFVLAESAKLVA